MKERFKIDPQRPERGLIARAVGIVREGGVMGYPTETVYGLGADPFDRGAVNRIFRIKGRDPGKPISLLIPDVDTLEDIVQEVPALGRELMDRFWPGPLTLVLKASPHLPEELLSGGDSIAVRISSHPIAAALLRKLGGPLTATSANRSDQAPCRSAAEVARIFGDELDLVVDGGPSRTDRPSSIVDVSSGHTVLLREGAVAAEEMEQVVGSIGRI